jgi:uncharacterized Fe-S cluster protein YjdI
MADTKPREYTADEVAVSFDANLCIHSGRCLKGLPEVFDLEKRPWIQPGNADAERVIETVDRCPSGALQWRSLKVGHAAPVAEEQPTMQVRRDGPIYVRGNVELDGGDGEPITESRRFALCRCGQSQNKPFCDNTHEETGWKAG